MVDLKKQCYGHFYYNEKFWIRCSLLNTKWNKINVIFKMVQAVTFQSLIIQIIFLFHLNTFDSNSKIKKMGHACCTKSYEP